MHELATFRRPRNLIVRKYKRPSFTPAHFRGKPFDIRVDYRISLEQMIAAGKYDWFDRYAITGENFSFKDEGTQDLICELADFAGHHIHVNKVLEQMKRCTELRLGRIEELLAFGAAHPDEQQAHPIFALGSVAKVFGERRVPCLDGNVTTRSLNLDCWWDGIWSGHSRFLAVRI